jgi:hypothetical protein
MYIQDFIRRNLKEIVQSGDLDIEGGDTLKLILSNKCYMDCKTAKDDMNMG